MIPQRDDDTIVALSSGQPPAAIAVIRTSGPHARAAAEALAGPLSPPRQAALRALRDPATKLLLDHALILRFDGPGSATGEDIVEYQCHGGRAVVRSILDALLARPGMRAAEPGEFTRRAFAKGRIDLTEAEGLADLLEAETERQRRAALLLADGALRSVIEDWRERIVLLSARAEAAIDYVDDEEETGVGVVALATDANGLAEEMRMWLDRPLVEPLRQGIRVVAAGPANAGKSSLINRLSESEKAIVTDRAGTTRDVIEVPLAIGGLPFVLVDTAGLREADDQVERIGIERAETEVKRADILLWLGDPDQAPPNAEVILIHARADQPGRERGPDGSLAVSSRTGEGISTLVELMIFRASTLLPGEDQLGLNDRQATELERAILALGQVDQADLVIAADAIRTAREALDRISGRGGIDDMLDALFGRFCLGK
ncbi:MAG: tRNA uridine-5-carboxymethylaminomethyl(34) synthesis GTPase MnmE [Pseudomonadota bacterium]